MLEKTKRKQLYLLFEPISKRLLRIFLQEQLFKVQNVSLRENIFDFNVFVLSHFFSQWGKRSKGPKNIALQSPLLCCIFSQERWSKNWVTILYCTQLHRNAMLYTNTKQFWEPKEVIFPLSFKEILLTKKEKKSQQTCNNLPWPSEKWGRRK